VFQLCVDCVTNSPFFKIFGIFSFISITERSLKKRKMIAASANSASNAITGGAIHVYLGCMFAGKSSLAIRMIRKWTSIDQNVLAVNHCKDNRYSKEGIRSHDLDSIPSRRTERLHDLLTDPEFAAARVIVIEEAQFFEDLVKFACIAADEYGKIVLVYGLDGKSTREPFGQMCELIPHADSVEKLQALCYFCKDGTLAPFTLCLQPLPSTGVLIGGVGVYVAACRCHYNEYRHKASAMSSFLII
jgi:thymidine kinase